MPSGLPVWLSWFLRSASQSPKHRRMPETSMDWRFDSRLYNEYQRYINDFDGVIAELEAQKAKLQKGFHFNKKEKLATIDYRIKRAHANHERYLKIREREKKFEETWFKDGKFIDLNKDNIQTLKKMSMPYIEKLVKECIDKHPEFMIYEFDGYSINGTNSILPIQNQYYDQLALSSLPYDVAKIFEKETASRTLKAVKEEPVKKSDEPKSSSENEPTEMGAE